MWMARISGEARDRLVSEGLIDQNSSWVDETAFGNYSSTGQFVWNDKGTNSTIYELLSWAKQRYCDQNAQYGVVPDVAGVQPTYFKEAYFAGLEIDPYTAGQLYGGLIPIVALYQIDWQKYYNSTG